MKARSINRTTEGGNLTCCVAIRPSFVFSPFLGLGCRKELAIMRRHRRRTDNDGDDDRHDGGNLEQHIFFPDSGDRVTLPMSRAIVVASSASVSSSMASGEGETLLVVDVGTYPGYTFFACPEVLANKNDGNTNNEWGSNGPMNDGNGGDVLVIADDISQQAPVAAAAASPSSSGGGSARCKAHGPFRCSCAFLKTVADRLVSLLLYEFTSDEDDDCGDGTTGSWQRVLQCVFVDSEQEVAAFATNADDGAGEKVMGSRRNVALIVICLQASVGGIFLRSMLSSSPVGDGGGGCGELQHRQPHTPPPPPQMVMGKSFPCSSVFPLHTCRRNVGPFALQRADNQNTILAAVQNGARSRVELQQEIRNKRSHNASHRSVSHTTGNTAQQPTCATNFVAPRCCECKQMSMQVATCRVCAKRKVCASCAKTCSRCCAAAAGVCCSQCVVSVRAAPMTGFVDMCCACLETSGETATATS